MLNGQRVFDADTHIHPSVEALEPYFDSEFRDRLPELEQYKVGARSDQTTTPREDPLRHHYAVSLSPYRRHLGDAEPREVPKDAHSRLHFGEYTGAKLPGVGVIDDAFAQRVADMDEEGTDVHMMVPDVAIGVSLLGNPVLEMGLIRAYHRLVNDMAAAHPGRFKALLAVSGTDVEGSVAEIDRWGKERWAAGVLPFAGVDEPMDHPRMEPLWAAAANRGLGAVHHSMTWAPPYFPGYKDMDNNRFLARLCSHPWGAMKTMAAFIGAGIMDRYPINFGVLESGVGWLPFWVRRMDVNAAYVGFTADLQHKMSEYVANGRFFASIEMTEEEDIVRMVMDFLGEDILMYASDYPHAECKFPDSPSIVQGWPSIGQDTMRKFMWDNAVRFFGEP